MPSSLLAGYPSPFTTSSSVGSRTFSDDGGGWDLALGGLPFRTLVSDDRPYTRQTAQTRKEQSDTSREPGEHSIAFWWLRSQSSFHGGAGQKYIGTAEGNESPLSAYRYATSEGVDVFTEPGSVTVLPKTQQVVTSAGTPLISVTSTGNMYVADGAVLTRYYLAPFGVQPEHPSSSMDIYSNTVAWGGGETILALATAGSYYFVATASGVWVGNGLGAATKIYTYTAPSTVVLQWVKQRLVLAYGQTSALGAVYELDPAAAAASPLPTPIFTTTRGWAWKAVADSPSAVLLAGDDGARSAVYKMTLDTSSAVPVLGPGVVVAEFPPAELVLGMDTYLGTVIGVQTTKGFRVGVLEDTGDFTYGGILVEHEWEKAGGAVFGYGNSLYAGWTNKAGVAGLARVDLSNSFGSGQSLRFPWAPDLRAQNASNVFLAGVTTQGTVWDYERRVFVVAGQGVFMQSHARLASGTLTTSRIRWDSIENKLIRSARLRGEGASGRLTLEVSPNSDTAFYPVGAIEVSQQTDSGDMYVQLDPAQFYTLRFTFTDSASLSGYQLKAMPSTKPSRIITIPLACFDREQTNGQISGGDGVGQLRLRALERLEQGASVVALQWFSSLPDLRFTEYVLIEQVDFQQLADAASSRGWGGVATVTLRTVE